MEQLQKPPRNSRGVPTTSHQAYQLVGISMKENHWNRIMLAMKLLSVPSSSQKIAEKADLPYISVARRMSELELEGLIEKTGKGLTETNRPCALWRLTNQPALYAVKEQEPTTGEENIMQLSIFE